MSNEQDRFFEQASIFLPKYLTPEQHRQLYEELRAFPTNTNYFTQKPDLRDELLQGDGWTGLVAINFKTRESKPISGVIISNSCDVNADNERALPVNVLFAPIIRLNRYEELLRKGLDFQRAENVVGDIRRQRVTSLIYLPAFSDVIEESIVPLDDIHSHPLDDFIQQERSKIFTLSQYGFYIFLLKLSIHFSRFQEGVVRL